MFGQGFQVQIGGATAQPQFFQAPQSMFQEGAFVRDKSSGAIYRIQGGHKCHLPNMGTYSSYGSPGYTDYDSHVLVNVPQGANIYPNGLHENQVVRDKGTGAIYLLQGGTKRHYPNMDVYTSHGKPAFTDIGNVADIVDGHPMGMAIGEGSVVSDKSNGKIYRIIGGHKCHYPNMEIYTSHGKPHATGFDSHALAHFPEGHPILPNGMYDGQIIRDKSSGKIHRLAGGHKCHFPNMDIYTSHGKPAYTDFDASIVNAIPEGPCVLPVGFHDGQIVRDRSNGAIYRLVGGKKCHFSSMQSYGAAGSPAYTDFDPHVLNPIPSGASI